MNDISLGRLAGLRLSARPSAFVGLAGLWAALSGVAVAALDLPLAPAVGAGLAATALHLASGLAHHLGHAWFARRAGHPMSGIQLWAVLARSVYPADEPDLPPATHIRRALGGPFASLLVTLAAGAATLLLPAGTARWVSLFWFLDNLFVFTLQVFLPLGFNDASTILRWWNVQRQQVR
jgi:hypothetical protein